MYRISLLFLLIPVMGWSQLTLADVFTNNMVLQRDKPIVFWGNGIPGKLIFVNGEGRDNWVRVGNDSAWRITLPARAANADPLTFTFYSSDDTIRLTNVLIGDVWLCIGQSNMEFPLSKEANYSEEIQYTYHPLLRFYNPVYAGKNIYGTAFTDSVSRLLTAEKFYCGNWQNCDSHSMAKMSAVAYYFGKEIADEMDIPIGLINLSIGGAPLETFIDGEKLKESKRFSAKVSGNWLENDALPVWVRRRGGQNVGDLRSVPGDSNGKNHGYKPGFAYTAGIKPLLGLPITGILCYQGESNAQEIARVTEYPELSALMIGDYREKWRQPEMPFYFVQLSSIDTANYEGQLWPQFRDEQRKMMDQISFSGMAISSDIGARDDVHPTNKRDVGYRLARWALCKTYGRNVIPSGPLPYEAFYSDGKIQVSFKYIGNGLKPSNGKSLKGFSIDGKGDVEANVENGSVVIQVGAKPKFVYYGWTPYSKGNLINAEGLPASTFKLEVK